MGNALYILPIAALILILVATVSNKIEAYFESQDEEDYESKNYRDETKDI